MKTLQKQMAIIGGGPAGLAAFQEAKRLGVDDVVLLERNEELGGILQQCIHDGFGLHRFQKQLSGPQYAQRFIDQVQKEHQDIFLHTMVTDIQGKDIYAVNREGVLKIEAQTIILAMGCRERTRNQVLIFGERPAGVLTAGSVQRYMNMEGLLPGKRAVILGSGDIGLIMARRMSLEGVQVEGVYEVMEEPGGLARNIYQCLTDYDIPLHLSTTVLEIHGKDRLTGVTVAKVDKNRNPIPETKRYIPCDLLVLSVGLIPENELSKKAGVHLSPITKGPLLDSQWMSNVPGIFACGNVSLVFDLVDYVSETGEMAARGAKAFLDGKLDDKTLPICYSEAFSMTAPTAYRQAKEEEGISLYMRTKVPHFNGSIQVMQGDRLIYEKKHRVMRPAEMVVAKLEEKHMADLKGQEPISVSLKEETP